MMLASTAALVSLSGCETLAEELTEAVGHEFVAALTPMSGGSGSGKVEISIDDATNVICTDLELTSDVGMTGGHLLAGNNAVVAELDVPGDDDDSEDCDSVSDGVIDNIIVNPGNYQVHITATTGLWGA